MYALCALTSAGCAVLLLRTYFQQRSWVLLWASLRFVGLAASNTVLFLDLVIWPETDLSLLRTRWGALATMTLVVGLVWETD